MGYYVNIHIKRSLRNKILSFSTVRQPEILPCKIMPAGRPFQISVAVASQLRLNLSSVLKLHGLARHVLSIQDCKSSSRRKGVLAAPE